MDIAGELTCLAVDLGDAIDEGCSPIVINTIQLRLLALITAMRLEDIRKLNDENTEIISDLKNHFMNTHYY